MKPNLTLPQLRSSTYSCIEKTYRGCAPMPSITAPNIRCDSDKTLTSSFSPLVSIQKALVERVK